MDAILDAAYFGVADGFKSRIDLLSKRAYLSAAQIIRANLAEIGIEIHDSGVWNRERWSSQEFDELHAAALVEMDPAKRNGGCQRERVQGPSSNPA